MEDNRMFQSRYDNFSQFGFFILLLAFVLQGVLILNLASHGVVGYFPKAHDQTAILIKAYNMYEQSIGKNLWSTLLTYLWNPTPIGALVLPEAVLSMHLFGPGRLACLGVNLAHFFLAQLCIWFCIQKFTRSTSAVWVCVGLFLMASFPFFFAGGIFDFRLDFAAVCLYTAVLSLVIASNFFLDKKVFPWLITAIIVLILTRFITAIYWFGITTLTLLFLLMTMRIVKRGQKFSSLRNRLRFRNLIILSLLVGLIITPVFIRNMKPIYNYYGIGHLIGSEKKIRAKESGTTETLASIVYYPKHFWRYQAGELPLAVGIAAVLLVSGYFLSVLRRKKSNMNNRNFSQKLDGVGWYFLSISLVVPLIILTMDVSKSPVVGAIFYPPLMLLAALGLFYLQGYLNLTKLFKIISSGLFIAGMAIFFNNAVQPQVHMLHNDYSKSINNLYEEIMRAINKRKINRPQLAFIDPTDALIAGSLNVWIYEKEGRLLNATDKLTGIFALSPQKIKRSLEAADVIIVPDKVRGAVYPYYDSIRSQWDYIKNYIRRNTTLLATVQIQDQNKSIERVYIKNSRK